MGQTFLPTMPCLLFLDPSMSAHVFSTLRESQTPIDVYLHPIKDIQICLAVSMPGADLLITNSLNLLVSLITVNTQYIKVRYQSFQEILKIKEYSNLFKRPHAIGRPTLNLIYQCLFLKVRGCIRVFRKGAKKNLGKNVQN